MSLTGAPPNKTAAPAAVTPKIMTIIAMINGESNIFLFMVSSKIAQAIYPLFPFVSCLASFGQEVKDYDLFPFCLPRTAADDQGEN